MEQELPGLLNFSWVIVTFFAAVGAGILLFGWPKPIRLSTRHWKALEIATVLLSLLGIYPQMAEIRRIVAGNLARADQSHVQFAFESLKRHVERMQPVVCFKGVRTEFSPPDFDRIEQDKQTLCALFEKAEASLPAEPPADLEMWGRLRETSLDDEVLMGHLRSVQDAGEDYLDVRRRIDNLRNASATRSEAEVFSLIFSPYALAVAAALIIVKIAFGSS